MTLSLALADRIRRLVPSLASSFDGEAIATRNAIGRELAAGGADWFALAASISGVSRRQEDGGGVDVVSTTSTAKPPPSAPPHMFGDLARACRDLDRGRLSARERDFVAQMCRLGFGRSPSPRQADWLNAIFARLQGRAAA